MELLCSNCKTKINTETDDYFKYTWGDGENSDTEYICSEKCLPDTHDNLSTYKKGVFILTYDIGL